MQIKKETPVQISVMPVAIWTGNDVRELRQTMHLRQREFAVHLGKCQSQVCYLEKFRDKPIGPSHRAIHYVLDRILALTMDELERRQVS